MIHMGTFNLEYLLMISIIFLALLVLVTIYKILTIQIDIDYDNLPPKTVIDSRKHSITYGFPHIFLNVGFILRSLLNLLYHFLARKLPLSVLRVLMHRCRGTTIGRNVVMAPNVQIDSSFPRLVFIGNNVALGKNTIIAAHSMPGGKYKDILEAYSAPVVIEDGSWIGINVVITAGVTIGKGSLVIAGSIVDSDVEAYTIVRGNPVNKIAKVPKARRE